MKKKVYIFSLIFFIIDLISKILVINTIKKEIVLIPNFLSFNKVSNEGAAFSILNGGRIFFILLGVTVIIYIVKYMLKSINNKVEILSYSLILGGIIGNLFDRIVYGKVVDFISFKIFGYYFPIFNLADSMIVIGAILLIINLIKGDKNEIRSK